jgi:hypothetical protein
MNTRYLRGVQALAPGNDGGTASQQADRLRFVGLFVELRVVHPSIE